MGLVNLEHGKLAYRADFALYGAGLVGLATFLIVQTPNDAAPIVIIWIAAGVLGWTLVEYLLHRFVLHAVQPFRRWHEAHHERPTALICAPTVLSAGLILVLVFLPARWLAGLWCACALTLGVLVGYYVYAIAHHATHHWRTVNGWLRRRKRWHAAHHHDRAHGCYGVTSGFWDHAFGTARPAHGATPRRAWIGFPTTEPRTPHMAHPQEADVGEHA